MNSRGAAPAAVFLPAWRSLLLSSLLLGVACDQAAVAPAAQQGAVAVAPAPAAPPIAEVAPVPSSVVVAAPEGASPSPAPSGEEPLVEEQHERDPRSATVTIKIIVDPRRKAHVLWGRKDLGLAPLELQRPRDSGPMDLVVNAVGYLPLHTRVFTDRNDQLNLRLFSAQEAPQLLGYTGPEPAPPPRRPP